MTLPNSFVTLNKNRVTIFVFLLFILSMMVSCAKTENQNGKLSTTDTQGNAVSIEKPAQRIVVLYEPLLETVYMLQKQETLVGIPSKIYTDADNHKAYALMDTRIAEKKIATPGDMESANLESLVAMNPDLVIAYQLSPNVISSLKEMGIAVYMGKSETYQDIEKEIKDLALLLDAKERGEALLSFAKKEFEMMAQAVKDVTPKSAYFSWANGRIYTTTGQTSMMHECLVFAGVKNVCTSEMDQANINPETLASWNPDVIFMWNDSPSLFYENPQLSQVNAIKNKQIYTLMPMHYFNPHTLKALLTTLYMQSWAYQMHSEDILLQKSKEYLVFLYGEKIGNALFQQFRKS